MEERHTKSFEYFDLEITLSDGDAEIVMRFPERVSSIGMVWDDVREILDFAAQHALGMKEPYVVEYEDTREAIEA